MKKRNLPRDPFDDMRRFSEKMQTQMNRMFNRVWDLSDFDFGSFERTGIRRALSDIEDAGKEVVIRMELPGVDKKDIVINAQGNQLEVSVKKKEESSIKKKNYFHSERSYRGFYRSLTLPVGVDTNKISAAYKSGILEIRIPKKKTKQGKRISVK